MKLSIIVPVYNMAANGKLNYCLDSLVNQTIEDYEIIAVDDGSKDDSPEIMKEYEAKYPKLFKLIFLPENIKQGGAKNYGLDAAEGEYVGFVDSDDWVVPDFYERLIGACEKDGSDIAACNLAYAYEHSMKMGEGLPGIDVTAAGEVTPENFKKLIQNFGTLVTKVYKREIFENPKLRFPAKMFYEDNALAVELAHRAKKISIINEPLYFYYQDPSSTTHTITEERCMDRMRAMDIMMDMAKQGGYYSDYKKELDFRFANLHYRNTLFSYMQGSQKKHMSFVRALGKEVKEKCPDFQTNPLFIAAVNAEERKFIRIQQKSTFLFWIYYKLIWGYRKMRSGKQ